MKFVFTLSKFFLSLIIIIIFAELFLRFSHIISLNSTEWTTKGARLMSNKTFVNFNEGFGISRSNSQSIIAEEDFRFKNKDKIRIAVMGDSYIEGFQLFSRHHFVNIMKDRIEEDSECNVEILNFGRSGFNINDNYCEYNTEVKKYSPDLTFCFVSDEDFYKLRSSRTRPFVEKENNQLKINYDYLESTSFKKIIKTRFVRNKFYLLSLLKRAAAVPKTQSLSKILFDKLYTVEEKPVKRITPEHTDPFILEILSSLNDQNVIIVATDNLSEEYETYLKENHIPYLRLKDVLGEDNEKNHYWKATNKYGHWNHYAHRMIGRYLSDVVSDYLQSKSSCMKQ